MLWMSSEESFVRAYNGFEVRNCGAWQLDIYVAWARGRIDGHNVNVDETTSMSKDKLYVEQRPEGDFAVRRPNSQRASAVEPTQAKAIERAKALGDPKPHIERVRETKAGKPDKWRS
jgi:hypothetical protein